jgi:hypothetical protein
MRLRAVDAAGVPREWLAGKPATPLIRHGLAEVSIIQP